MDCNPCRVKGEEMEREEVKEGLPSRCSGEAAKSVKKAATPNYHPCKCKVNKMDNLRLQASTSRLVKDCCVMVISETWLHSAIPDITIY